MSCAKRVEEAIVGIDRKVNWKWRVLQLEERAIIRGVVTRN